MFFFKKQTWKKFFYNQDKFDVMRASQFVDNNFMTNNDWKIRPTVLHSCLLINHSVSRCSIRSRLEDNKSHETR